jgi:outer membrane protein
VQTSNKDVGENGSKGESMTFLICVLITGFVFSPMSSRAGEEDLLRLSLEEAVALAKSKNERLKISNENIEKAYQEYREARSHMLPQVNGSIGWNHYFQAPKITLPPMNGSPATQLSIKRDFDFAAEAQLTQVLWAFGKVTHAIKAADRGVQVEKYSKDLAEDEITFETKAAYYRILLARKALDIIKGSYQNARDNQKEVKERFRGGRVSRFDHIKMKADIASRAPLVLDAQKNYYLAKNALKTIMGVSASARLELLDDFSNSFQDFDKSKLQIELEQSNPGLLTLQESIAVYDHLVTQQERRYFPTLSGIASYSYSGDGDDFYIGKDNMFSTFLAGVMLTFPIWDSGAISSQYHQTMAGRNILNFQLKQTKRNLSSELDSAIEEYESSREILKTQKEASHLAGQSYQLSRETASAGKASQTEVNDAELRWTNAQLSLEHTIFQLHCLQARIEFLVSKRKSS